MPFHKTAMLILFVHVALGVSAQPPTAPAADRVAAWRQDLRELATELPKRHVDPFTRISRDDFERAIAELEGRLADLSEEDIQLSLVQIVARIGDSHTNFIPNLKPPLTSYAIGLVTLKDGVYVSAAAQEHAELLGAKLLRVGGVEVAEVRRKLAGFSSHENDVIRNRAIDSWMMRPQVLRHIGVIGESDELRVDLEARDGRQMSAMVKPVERGRPGNVKFLPNRGSLPMPKLQRRRRANYWFEYLPEHRTMFVRYDKCENHPDQDVRAFAKELFDAIDANDVQRVIIDLRYNPGGNSALFRPILEGLRSRKVNRQGGLFVLIGGGTHSSALMNAIELKNATAATLAGSPTGQKPNHFGEVRSFKLAHSQCTVLYSTKRFVMMPGSDPPSLVPDLLVEPAADEYFDGRDVVIEAVLAYPQD